MTSQQIYWVLRLLAEYKHSGAIKGFEWQETEEGRRAFNASKTPEEFLAKVKKRFPGA